MTYKAIAAELARRRGVENMSAHAVGGAVSHNPISLIIPWHRVVGTNTYEQNAYVLKRELREQAAAETEDGQTVWVWTVNDVEIGRKSWHP